MTGVQTCALPILARCVGRGVGEVGVGLGHASLASYGGGGLSRAGKERASLARCVGRGVGEDGACMGHASLASYESSAIDAVQRLKLKATYRWHDSIRHHKKRIRCAGEGPLCFLDVYAPEPFE